MTGLTDCNKYNNISLIITVGILAWFRIFLVSKMCVLD